MRKPAFCICENKNADQLRGNRKADHALVFATWIVQFLFYLNPKFQASSHLLCLYSPVCMRAGRKPRRPVFSQRGSNISGNDYVTSLPLQMAIYFNCFFSPFWITTVLVMFELKVSMSHVMRKPAFYICKNKGADQLRCNCTADQRLCFRYIDSAIPLLLKSETSSL